METAPIYSSSIVSPSTDHCDTPESLAEGTAVTGSKLLAALNPDDWVAAQPRRCVGVRSSEQSWPKAANDEKPKDKVVLNPPHEIVLAKPLKWNSGFEMSPKEITDAGLDEKVTAYKAKVAEALHRHGASYKVDLRIVGDPARGPYGTPLDADVWTETIRGADMRNESFVINVTAKFLKEQPAILFESSSLHEIAHIMNDDLSGYHRQGANTEIAEERRVADLVGMARYEEYLRAYTKYKPSVPFDTILQKVKDVELVPPPIEKDDADKAAAEYFKTHDDGKEHLLVYNGNLHDITLTSTPGSVSPDLTKLNDVIKVGKPMIFFHNHPADGGTPAMFPSYEDYGAAGRYSFLIYKENPKLSVEFRVMQIGKEEISNVTYGFKRSAIDEIKKNAEACRSAVTRNEDAGPIEMKQNILNYHLAQDSYHEYLKHAYLLEVARSNKDACRVRPQYFLWPSERFFLQDRPQSTPKLSPQPKLHE